jgi:hypothetical protein
VRFAREARRVADRPYDPRGQYGTYAEDLGEGGARRFRIYSRKPFVARGGQRGGR